MKIIYINGSRIPTERAHGLQIMKMCEALAEIKNANLELWVPGRFNYIKEDPFEYYGVERNFKIRRFFCIDLIPWDKFLGPLALWITEFSFLVAISYQLSAKSSEIIYTRDKFVAFFLSFFKKNIFFEAHDMPSGVFFSRLKKAKGIIAITQNLKNEFIKHGVDAEKIAVAPDGVDIEEFDITQSKEECREKFGLPLDKKIVLYSGHLYKWKGVDTLVETARLFFNDRAGDLGTKKSSIYFVLVGGTGTEVASYKLKATKYHLENVLFVGHRPHKEIPYWLKVADILVLPNSAKYDISQYWTSPLKMFEYMASGRPIIASSLPSIKEILNENNARMFEADNAISLSNAIMDVLGDVAKAKRISGNSYQDVKNYTWQARSEAIWHLFQKN